MFLLGRPLELAVKTDAFYTMTIPGRQGSVYPIRGNPLATLFLDKAERDLPDFSGKTIWRKLRTAHNGMVWVVPELFGRLDEAAEAYFDRTDLNRQFGIGAAFKF